MNVVTIKRNGGRLVYLHSETGFSVCNVEQMKQALTRTDITDSSRAKNRARLSVLERDGFKCVLCGSPDLLTIDHIRHGNTGRKERKLPSSYRGDSARTLCAWCHQKRNDEMKQ